MGISILQRKIARMMVRKRMAAFEHACVIRPSVLKPEARPAMTTLLANILLFARPRAPIAATIGRGRTPYAAEFRAICKIFRRPNRAKARCIAREGRGQKSAAKKIARNCKANTRQPRAAYGWRGLFFFTVDASGASLLSGFARTRAGALKIDCVTACSSSLRKRRNSLSARTDRVRGVFPRRRNKSCADTSIRLIAGPRLKCSSEKMLIRNG